MYLGREPLRGRLINWAATYSNAQKIINDLGLDLNSKSEVRTLSVAQQQMVEISKALTMNAKLIVMDEPTAALSGREVDKLHDIIADLKARGISIIYVSHKLNEVKKMCDRYTVFRDGKYVSSGNVADVTVKDMVRIMVGRDVEPLSRGKLGDAAGRPVLRVVGVSRGPGQSSSAMRLRDMSVEVRAGEIIGFAGLVGAGRTELARVIFGADPIDEGVIYLDGTQISPIVSPESGLRSGIALVPEDRKQQGCFLTHSIRQNMSLPSLKQLSKWSYFVDRSAELEMVESYRKKLSIKMANDAVLIGTLSGGNQQKVLLARCMALRPKVLIVDEPTRGIDVGAKAEVHQVLFDMAAMGTAVIVISSELQEVMAVSDNIVTFREGQITGITPAAGATEQQLMNLMAIGVGEVHAVPA
jgi:inositol transport system ATP-binding protein